MTESTGTLASAPPNSSRLGSGSSAPNSRPRPPDGPSSRRSSSSSGRQLVLSFTETALRFIAAVRAGQHSEYLILGPRGEGKTITCLAAMVAHAVEHQRAGYALPVRWLGVRDSFENHKANAHLSLLEPIWDGQWAITDSGHRAVFDWNGTALVDLRLVGIPDFSELEKLRTAVHGVWFEEPAPITGISHSGLTVTAYGTALSSARLDSYANPILLSANYPDESHWLWSRFVEEPNPGTVAFEIPGGERVKPEMRARWAQMYAHDPGLKARLVDGQPGLVAPGLAVAAGYVERQHVLREAPRVVRHANLWCGWDAGLAPSTVIAQRVDGHIVILAGLTTPDHGMRQHLERAVRPWFAEWAPWILQGERERLLHYHDPAMVRREDSDSEQTAVGILRRELGGSFHAGPQTWPGRKEPLLAALALLHGGTPLLQIGPGPETHLLRRALRGAWYYPRDATGQVRRDKPEKPNVPYADLGDALCYLIAGMHPLRRPNPAIPVRVPAPAYGFTR
jgi:hypothetical protein